MKKLRAMGLAAILVGFGLAAGATVVHAGEPLDLNQATLEEIMKLPIDAEDAQAIWEYREYRAYFSSIYELRTIPGITQEELNALKPLVKIVPVPIEDEELQRVNEIYYRIRNWEAEEGASEALVDYWIDLARDPLNVNKASYWEIANLQQLSPTDAAAIYNYTRRNRLERRSQLRNVPGLTYWGYYNARNFVRYDDPSFEGGPRGSYQYRLFNTDVIFDVEEVLREDRNLADGAYDSWWDRLRLDYAPSSYQHKVRTRWRQDIRAGALVYHGFGSINQPDVWKFNVTLRNKSIGPVRFDNTILGNYQIAFGQGLVMQNTDFFKSRNSGFGWDKRYIGILDDISQTEEYKMWGAATEFQVGDWRTVLFYSDDWKDAVLNPDGSANQHLIMTPRVTNSDLEAGGLRAMRDVLHERTFGGNLKYVFAPGTWVGVSGYQSWYNKYFKSAYDPDGTTDVTWIVNDDDEDNLVATDSEYWSTYTSPGKYRRVWGTEFQWVYDNYSFAGEFAGLDVDGDLFDFGADPKAFVVNGWASFSNLNLLALYRDYDVEFDNPYNRAFSEYKRFKGTVLEDQYYLTDPLYAMLFVNSVTPQAERGLYLSSRYRFSHTLTPSIDFDVWERKADGADYGRLLLRLRYQPIYNIVMNLRQKWQGRWRTDWLTPMSYDQVETRFRLEYRLSKYDEVEFLLSRSWINWPPRPRLVDNADADGGHPDEGSAGLPSYAVGGAVTHNFNEFLRVTAAVTYYDGFLWIFEDGQFSVRDKRAVRWWLAIADRISDHLAIRFRWTNDHGYPLTYVDAREYNENPPGNPEPDAWYVRDDINTFRLQVDYSW
jgi:DNA uptake protein ComE-like DNA-binding protein